MKTSKIGRPREFDADEALGRALEVFWRRGYEGASLSELTDAMGITRPSLYAAYGNKEELFRKALDKYCARASAAFACLEDPSARAAIEGYLTQVATGGCSEDQMRGCLLVQGALSCSEEGDRVRTELARRRNVTEQTLRARLERARDEGDLPVGLEPADFARFLATLGHGLAVQAAGGVPVADRLRVVAVAMRVWPA